MRKPLAKDGRQNLLLKLRLKNEVLAVLSLLALLIGVLLLFGYLSLSEKQKPSRTNVKGSSRKIELGQSLDSFRAAAALQKHKGLQGQGQEDGSSLQAYCEQHFGLAWAEAWNATAAEVCKPDDKDLKASSMTCRKLDADQHMPEAARPHVMCSVKNLLLDPSRLTRAPCPKFRPGYLCRSKTYNHYAGGAFGLACHMPDLDPAKFPKDHLRDIMDSMASVPTDAFKEEAVESIPTLLMTREIEEHANVFHAMTDLLNAYISLTLLKWHNQLFKIVFLDNHPPGPLDPLWTAIATSNGTLASPPGTSAVVRRAESLGAASVFEQAVFVPPGYSSLLFAHLYEANSCPQPTTLFQAFKRWVHQRLQMRSTSNNSHLQVTLISRRPKVNPRTKKAMPLVRGISNEAELHRRLTGIDGVAVALVDLSTLSLASQLDLIVNTDILIGMHGAALAWALLMKEGAAVVELWPQTEGMWRCYEHMSEWSGVLYRRWSNAHPQKRSKRGKGDVTEIDAEAVYNLVLSLVRILHKAQD